MNILITSANSAAAYQLKNKLNNENIIMGDYLELPGFMLQAGKMITLPDPASVSYPHAMLSLCLDNQVKTVYVLREGEIAALEGSVQLFKEYNIAIVF